MWNMIGTSSLWLDDKFAAVTQGFVQQICF